MPYGDKVIDHFQNPRNVGAPECGDVMKLQIMVDEHDNIVDAKFKTFGCGSAIASSSLATEWIKGRKLGEALDIKNTDIVRELALPPVKIHCSVLAEDAIKAAVKDLKEKRARRRADDTSPSTPAQKPAAAPVSAD